MGGQERVDQTRGQVRVDLVSRDEVAVQDRPDELVGRELAVEVGGQQRSVAAREPKRNRTVSAIASPAPVAPAKGQTVALGRVRLAAHMTGTPTTPSHTGRLVVATQRLADPNFAHAVVLLVEHGAEGAFGVVLNRPGDVPITDALAPWAALASEPPVVFTGGPVQPDGVLGLGRLRETNLGTEEEAVLPGVQVVDLTVDPMLAATDYRGVRLFSGYAGWGPGQLEVELADGAWFVVDAEPTDILTADPDGLWRVVLARQGGLFVTIPEDPSLN